MVDPATFCDMKASPQITLVRKLSGNSFPCLLCALCQCSWHQTSTNLKLAKLFNNCDFTAFSDTQHEPWFSRCYAVVATCTFINPADVWHQCTSANTPQFAIKCRSPCFSFFDPLYPLSDSTYLQQLHHIHSFSVLSDDRSKASSKTIPSHSAI